MRQTARESRGDGWALASQSGAELLVLVQPRSSRTRVVGVHDGRLKIALAAPPVDGEANEALVCFLADTLGLRRAAVELLEGASSRRKRVALRGVSLAQVRALLPSAE